MTDNKAFASVSLKEEKCLPNRLAKKTLNKNLIFFSKSSATKVIDISKQWGILSRNWRFAVLPIEPLLILVWQSYGSSVYKQIRSELQPTLSRPRGPKLESHSVQFKTPWGTYSIVTRIARRREATRIHSASHYQLNLYRLTAVYANFWTIFEDPLCAWSVLHRKFDFEGTKRNVSIEQKTCHGFSRRQL